MGSIHAFMTGVNAYPAHIAKPLTGCVNDITEARRLLTDRTGGAARVRVLLDGAVTVAAVEDGIRTFLGAAGPGDTALFWFSGHGTETVASGADLLIEATGRNQALVCADGPLLDKRLGALLGEVAGRGAHVVAVLDCCYSGGATRDDAEAAGMTARFAPPPPRWGEGEAARSVAREDMAGDAAQGVTRDVELSQVPPRHLLLAASRLDQPSYEKEFDGRRHGVFTHALLGAARTAGPDTTYRQLLAAADARVQRAGGGQRPVLYPEAPGVADLPFLGGAVAGATGDHLLRFGAHGWEVDCGTGHGLRDGAGAEGTEFSVVDTGWAGEPNGPIGSDSSDSPNRAGGEDGTAPGGVLRARVVRADRTLVDPVDWLPDTARVYPVVLSALASAPATVSVAADGLPGAAERLAAAVASAGPGGGPSPLLQVVDAPGDSGDPHFRVVARDGFASVLDRDGTALVDPLPFGEDPAGNGAGDPDPRRLAACLTHLAGWRRLRDFTSRPSVLDNQVRVEIVPWDAPDGPALVPDGRGEIVRAYGAGSAERPREPWVSIRLHNRSQRALWCVLLDLTDSYAADSALFPGHFIGPGRTGHALDGDPVQLSLPPSRPLVPGAEVRDWLKLIVAEGELNTVPFRMRAWDPARAVSRADGAAAEDPGTAGVLRFEGPDRSGGRREAGRVTGAVPVRWATRTIALRTVVPWGPTGPGA
ncbi:caspase domain-containing protein [Streptomyces sp. NPDC087270]|uniref:caspase family protein n=1 Tax=Streptomyces sp. NPDC087270 TaxID=3365774 RepID=UPI00381ADFE5